MRVRCVLAGLAALLIPAATTYAAACPKGATCSAITVPLDHSGAVAGTLPLAYARVPATGARTGTLVLLSGGPGQAAIPLTESFTRMLDGIRAHYDLVFVDQRGTGRSGAVTCPPFEAWADAGPCAERFGERRAFMSTTETASDLEDLRVALGVEQLTLLGVSYGTQLAAVYGRRFPDRTAALILDSPVPVNGTDPFDRTSIATFPRMLKEVCTGRCRRTAGDLDVALRRAVARLPLKGDVIDFSDGERSTVTVTERRLLDTLRDADFAPLLRAELPAAIASLARGDAGAFIHAFDYWTPGRVDTSSEVNQARLFATDCIETPLPWAPDSPLAGRAAAARAFIATLGPKPFAPFTTATAYDGSLGPACEVWPPTPRPAPVTAPAPNVPVLVISGHEDTRTPLENARTIAAEYPRATLLTVKSVGHSVLRNDYSGCALDALKAFLGGAGVPPCEARPRARRPRALVDAGEYIPVSLGAIAPSAVPGRPGRTLSAVYYAIADAFHDRDGWDYWYGLEKPRHLAGRRGGYLRASRQRVELHAVETIRGVRVSGRLNNAATGTVVVSGPAAAGGTLTFRRGKVTGTLGGRRISD